MALDHTITQRAEIRLSGSWQAFPGFLEAEPDLETSGGVSPLQFGAATLPTATIRCLPGTLPSGWYRAPVRCYQTVSLDGAIGTEEITFSGILIRRRPGAGEVVFEAGGWDQRIETQRVQTPLRYRRFLATATTLTSVEDPSAGGYGAGLLNEVFWRAGGRPAIQLASYPSAAWYYACDPSSVAPEWAWLDGENAWNEALALAEAAGGQIYVDTTGIVRYLSPLSFAEAVGGAPVIADTGPHAAGRVIYTGDASVEYDLSAAYNVATCAYKRRALQARQEVYRNKDAFTVDASSSVQRTLSTQWPCLWRALTTNAINYAVTVTAIRYDGSPATPSVAVLSESAQSLVVNIVNGLSEPIQVAEIAIDAQPVAVSQEGVARFAGARFDANAEEDVERRLPDSIYTQSQASAERRARQAVTYDGLPRAVYTVSGAAFTPGVVVGGYATFSSSTLGVSSVPVRILRRKLTEGTMELRLVDVSGLRKLSELWVVGQSYAPTDQRRYDL